MPNSNTTMKSGEAMRSLFLYFRSQNGFSLIELTVVLVVIGILTAVAMQSMTGVVENSRTAATEQEMNRLAEAIVGDPTATSQGMRSDFGYVGDVGAFPPNLEALRLNPGYASWNGPYIVDGFAEENDGYKKDAWGTDYSYNGTTISSTGGPETIRKSVTDSPNDYLNNHFEGNVKDALDSIPGILYRDSVTASIRYPNGSGGWSTKTVSPEADGDFAFDSIPVGSHELNIVFAPEADTLTRFVTILPRHRNDNRYPFRMSTVFTSGYTPTSASEILRPIGNGNRNELIVSGCVNNFECVNEVTADDDATYLSGSGGSWKIDTYELANHSTGSGAIDSVVIHIRCTGPGAQKEAGTYIHANGNDVQGTQIDLSSVSTWTDYQTTYASNPVTGSAWTWSEIDNIEAGIGLRKESQCTQVWIEVFYTY